MSKKDFSFHYNLKTKTGTMQIGKKYISLKNSQKNSSKTKPSSSGGYGYGLNLIWED